MKKIVSKYALVFVVSIAAGLFGLVIGASLSASMGFPAFGGAASGYEAGGVFFGLLIYALVTVITAVKLRLIPQTRNAAMFGLGVMAFVLMVLLYDYHMSAFRLFLILLLPILVIEAGKGMSK